MCNSATKPLPIRPTFIFAIATLLQPTPGNKRGMDPRLARPFAPGKTAHSSCPRWRAYGGDARRLLPFDHPQKAERGDGAKGGFDGALELQEWCGKCRGKG